MAQWVTVKEAAAMLGYTEQWTRRLIERNMFETIRPGHEWFISRASLEAYIERRDNPQEP